MTTYLTIEQIAEKLFLTVQGVNKWTTQGLEFEIRKCKERGRPFKVVKLSILKRWIRNNKPKYCFYLKKFKK